MRFLYVFQFCTKSNYGSIFGHFWSHLACYLGPKVKPSLQKKPSKQSLKTWRIFDRKLAQKWVPKKWSFCDFGDSWPLWCQVGPRGEAKGAFWSIRRPKSSKYKTWRGRKKLSRVSHWHILQSLISHLPMPFSLNSTLLYMCFFAQLSLGQSSPRLGGKTYGGSPLTWPRPKILQTRFRQAKNPRPPFRGLKLMWKNWEIWVPKWHPKW